MKTETEVTFVVRAKGYKLASEIEEILRTFSVSYTTEASSKPARKSPSRPLKRRKRLTQSQVDAAERYLKAHPHMSYMAVSRELGMSHSVVHRIANNAHPLQKSKHP